MLNLNAFNKAVETAITINQDSINSEKLEPIHPQTICYKNSVNILVGKQGSGKTFTCAYEIAKISQLHHETHLLIIVCKNENSEDPTIKSLSSLIRIPIVYVTEDEAEEYVGKLLAAKRRYSAGELEDGDLELLHVEDTSRAYLHTLLLFNDVAKSKLFSRPTNYFNQLLPICRHIQCSFFLNVQFWKSVPPEIKANATLVFVFGGFDTRQLYYIFSQVPTALSIKNIIPAYKALKKHDKLIVDCETGTVYRPL